MMNPSRQKRLPVGISDFEEMITQNYYFVDKSLLIKEILDSGAKVTLIPRPRRFGKTLNLSMIKCFFEIVEESKAHLFNSLKITEYPEIMKHQGRSPVIFLTFKDVKDLNWKECSQHIMVIISSEFKRHEYLLKDNFLDKNETKYFTTILSLEADQTSYKNALKNLSYYLHRYHKQKPIILIDEYDAPIHSGFVNKYYDQIIGFMRIFLSAGVKDNSNLQFCILTGILRVAKESIFSGLNNLKVCSMLSNFYADKFGLLENEVEQIVHDYDLDQKEIAQIKSWYNGYKIGNQTIYNPWSIINLIDEKGLIQPYWINTSSNDIIKELFFKSDLNLKNDIETLLSKTDLKKMIKESISFQQVFSGGDIVWSFMLFSGYLTYTDCFFEDGLQYCNLKIPNIEVLSFFKETVLEWLKSGIDFTFYQQMLKSLIVGNTNEFKKSFTSFVIKSLSYFDVSGDEPEKFYHAFVLGMFVTLQATHQIKSNRESGFGRYDVMMIPKDKNNPGVIIEFKKVDIYEKETLQDAAHSALKQIEEKKYEQELLGFGIKKIIKLAIVFDGKKVLIQEE